jgi:hypothetical protein
VRRSLEDVFDFFTDERNIYDPRIKNTKLTDGPIGRRRARARTLESTSRVVLASALIWTFYPRSLVGGGPRRTSERSGR